jgi:hypothetical protein
MGVKLSLPHLRKKHILRKWENIVLRRLFGLRELHNGDLHNLFCSPNIIRIIKSRKVRCVGHRRD